MKYLTVLSFISLCFASPSAHRSAARSPDQQKRISQFIEECFVFIKCFCSLSKLVFGSPTFGSNSRPTFSTLQVCTRDPRGTKCVPQVHLFGNDPHMFQCLICAEPWFVGVLSRINTLTAHTHIPDGMTQWWRINIDTECIICNTTTNTQHNHKLSLKNNIKWQLMLLPIVIDIDTHYKSSNMI